MGITKRRRETQWKNGITGRLICLEGIEAAGKTTQINFIAHYLKEAHKTVITTREPGGTPLAERIRQLILSPQMHGEVLTAEAECLLMFAARAQHITYTIQPALSLGHWVVCDRFIEASFAYQEGGRGLSHGFIETLQEAILKNLPIDRVLLFDLPVTAALERIHQRPSDIDCDRIESEALSFFERVRATYLTRAQQYPERYRIIDANVSLNKVQQQVMQVLDELF